MAEQNNFNDLWLNIQEHDLSKWVKAQAAQHNIQGEGAFLRIFNKKGVEHFEAYTRERTCHAQRQVSPYLAPPWCSFNDSSLLWIAGCKPSFFIRLVYILCGVPIEGSLLQMLEGFRVRKFCVSDLQLFLINELSNRTRKEENALSAEMVAFQEKMADKLLAKIGKEGLNQALGDHAKSMVRLLDQADTLRIRTLKEMVWILKPAQTVDFLIGSRKIHKYMHQIGKERDLQHV